MNSSFDDWYVDTHCDIYIKHRDIVKEAFEGGASSRQAEVDELQSEVKGYKSIYGKLELERDELQKRIDDARKLINLFFDGESLDHVVSANYILKGNQND